VCYLRNRATAGVSFDDERGPELGTAGLPRTGSVSILSAHLIFFHDLEKRPMGLWRTEEGPNDLSPRARKVS
jgi:hypothetical protein